MYKRLFRFFRLDFNFKIIDFNFNVINFNFNIIYRKEKGIENYENELILSILWFIVVV